MTDEEQGQYKRLLLNRVAGHYDDEDCWPWAGALVRGVPCLNWKNAKLYAKRVMWSLDRTANPALLDFDAEPLKSRIEAFALLQKLGAEEPLNGKVIQAVRNQKGYEPEVLREAERLTDTALAQFYDAATGTFYLAPQGEVPLVTRPTSLFDGAIPSGASVT